MNKPNIRFNTFSDSWNNRTIEDLFELRNGYTPSKAVDAFWTNGTIPWFRMEDIRSKGNKLAEAFQKITPEAVKNGGLFKQNSIILATTATIGEHAMLIADSLANQRFTNFKIRKSLECDYLPDFINYAFYKIDQWCLKNTNSGGLLSVDLKSLIKQPFYAPSLLEQNKISKFLQKIESTIECENKKLASLKQVKSACLQSMFPQEGESVPKVRFKGFDEEWNTISFSEAFDFLRNNSLSRAELAETGTVYNIHYGDILIKFGDCLFIRQNSDIPFIKDEKIANKLISSSLIKNGDIIFADAAEDYTVGKCIEIITKQENKIVSGLHTIACRPTLQFASGYLGYYLNSTTFHAQLVGMIQGSKVCSISKKGLLTTHLIYPKDLAEQQQIAAYFENLDKQISLQTQRLEKLKHIKSACLDKMFV